MGKWFPTGPENQHSVAWVQDHRISALETEIQRIEREIGSLMRRVSTQPHLARGIAELRHQKRDRELRIALTRHVR